MNNILLNLKYIFYQCVESSSNRDHEKELILHQEVMKSFLELSKFVPSHLQDNNIENIILAKGMVYNTGIDKSVRQYFYLNKALDRFSFNKKISSAVSSKIIDLKDSRLRESMMKKPKNTTGHNTLSFNIRVFFTLSKVTSESILQQMMFQNTDK